MLVGPFDRLHLAASTGKTGRHRRQVDERVVLRVAHVVHLADSRLAGAAHQGIDDIVDEQAVAPLIAAAEQFDRLAEQSLADEHGQEAELVARQALSRPVHVGEAQRGDRHRVRAGVDEVKLLAGQLGHAVHVDGSHPVILVDREPDGAPVHLPGGSVHHPRVRVDSAEHLEEPNVGERVQVEVAFGFDHRRGVAHLTGEVEDDLSTMEQLGDALVADVRDQHVGLAPFDVAAIAAMAFDEGIDHPNLGAGTGKLVDEVRSDEPEAAGDHAAHAGEGVNFGAAGHAHSRAS
ncbi:MAG: hypothetical protein FD127_3411 [Acidimicrobiaceae bacterium]|nr:MAG: hypothetical protein FD127_3411 [Acidimicrobiaceae bacterium]